MKKKLTMMLIMLFIVMFTVNVKASYIGAYSIIVKGEDSRWLYNSMPTDIKRGDIVSVKVMLKDAKDLERVRGYNRIFWDKEAFEIVENNNAYVEVLNDDIEAYINFEDENRIALYYYYGDSVPSSNNEQIVEFKFKVKNNAKDGAYKISEMFDDGGVSAYIDGEDEESYSSGIDLKFQIGKTKMVSVFSKDNIAPGSYVIGKHLFTRDGSDEYNGSLTTEHIMLASKTIESNNKDDMIVYVKSAHGDWFNAISNADITPPNNFDIEYVDMKSSYQENGIFTDSNEKTILSVVQFNDNEAIVSIEDENINVHGIASVNNHVVSLSINGKNYNITLSDEEAVISTNDAHITNKRLAKRANYTVNNYYGRKFGNYDSDYNPVAYLRSNQTGKYISGNKELYFLKISDTDARVCIKDKSSTKCEYNEFAYNGDGGYYVMLDESAFVVSTEEQEYGFSWQDNGIRISCEGNCVDNPYVGNYTKESSLTMEDVFHTWEENYVEYKVTFDFNHDEWVEEYYIRDGVTLDDYIYDNYMYDMIYEPYRENYKFVEWQLNGAKLNLDMIITGPITLVAVWEDEIKTPSLLVQLTSDYYVKKFSIDNLNDYCINNCDADDKSQREYSIDGYEIYTHGNDDNYSLHGVLVPVDNVFSIKSSFLPYEEAQITVDPNQTLNFAIRAYTLDENNHKHFSDYSSDQVISTLIPVPTIKFDTVAGSNVDYINYENGEYIYRIYVQNNSDFINSDNTYKVDGFELLEKKENGGYQYVANMQLNAATEIRVNENDVKEYFVKPYARNSYAELVYGPVSNTIIANQHFTVTFNSNGGSIIPAVSVMKGNAVVRPTDPQKDNYDFGGWKLNGETYDFSTPVTADITLVAEWEVGIATPQIAFGMGDGNYAMGLLIVNESDYCSGVCNGSSTDEYNVDGYILYKKNGSSYIPVLTQYFNQSEQAFARNLNDEVEDETYVARMFVNGNGETIYSANSNELVLHANENGYACYLHNETYAWGHYRDVAGYVKEDSKVGVIECIGPTVCYHNGDNYEWTDSPQDGWEVVETVTNESDCHAPVVPTTPGYITITKSSSNNDYENNVYSTSHPVFRDDASYAGVYAMKGHESSTPITSHNPSDLTCTSGDTSIATCRIADGRLYVTGVSRGTTTITLSSSASGDYTAASVTYSFYSWEWNTVGNLGDDCAVSCVSACNQRWGTNVVGYYCGASASSYNNHPPTEMDGQFCSCYW